MSLFGSSWEYYAFAASSSLFDENEHPETFKEILLQGLRMDDSFANILAFSYRTDMYARSKAMVRYALKDTDGFILGLPTSDLNSIKVDVELSWIESAIIRETKIPLQDFNWIRDGVFDTDFHVRSFIDDHYLDMNYFPWPDPCLTKLVNPSFTDGDTGWDVIPFESEINVEKRIGEISTTTGTLYNQTVGIVSPGEEIYLRAVCDRGSNDPDDGQLGAINLTFYDNLGEIISTESVAKTMGIEGEWSLLELTAIAPAGTVTAKAWASATIGGFIVTAKWLGSSGLDNYYVIGNTADPGPKVWTGGLIPATGSGDNWQEMTLVFCVYPVAHDDDAIFIFGAGQMQFTVGTSDSDGGFFLAARDAGTNVIQSVTPNLADLTEGMWHSVMISASPFTYPDPGVYVEIWIDGVEEYAFTWDELGPGFNPMDYVGPCYVGAGDYAFGTPDLWAGLNCYLAYVWCKEEYLDPNEYWDSFFDVDNKPKNVGVDGSLVTGFPPESYFPNADFTDNQGTGPNWTEIGTVPAAPSSPSD